MRRDLLSNIEPKRAISPAAAVTDNTPFVSQIIDTAGFDSLTIVINTGSLADADATFAVTMTEGNDSALADGAAVDASQILGGLANASFDFSADNKVFMVGYAGIKRYVQLTITPSNNAGNAFISAVAILGHPAVAPTTNPPA